MIAYVHHVCQHTMNTKLHIIKYKYNNKIGVLPSWQHQFITDITIFCVWETNVHRYMNLNTKRAQPYQQNKHTWHTHTHIYIMFGFVRVCVCRVWCMWKISISHIKITFFFAASAEAIHCDIKHGWCCAGGYQRRFFFRIITQLPAFTAIIHTAHIQSVNVINILSFRCEFE